MSKIVFKQKAEVLLKNVNQLEHDYRARNSSGVGNVPAETLKKIREKIVNVLIPEIDRLSGDERTDSSKSQAIATLLKSMESEYIRLHKGFSQSKVNNLKAEEEQKTRHDQGIIKKQIQFYSMLDSLRPTPAQSASPSISDPELETLYIQMWMHHQTFDGLEDTLSTMIRKSPGREKDAAYTKAINILSSYEEQSNRLNKQIEDRKELIPQQQKEYQQVERLKAKAILEATHFLSRADLAAIRAKNRDTTGQLIDRSLEVLIQNINTQLTLLKDKKPVAEKISITVLLQRSTEELQLLTMSLDALQNKVTTAQQESVQQESVHQESVHQESVHQESVHQESVQRESVHQESVHQESAQRESVQQEQNDLKITERINSFNHFYKAFASQLEIFPRLMEPLIKLKTEFEQIGSSGSDLEKLNKAVEKIKEIGIQQLAKINDELREQIIQAQKHFTEAHQAIEVQIEQESFKFTKKEQDLINAAKVPFADIGPLRTKDELMAKLKLIQQKSVDLVGIQNIINNHQKARALIKEKDARVSDLADVLKNPDNAQFLGIIALYDEGNNYLKILERHIDLFDKTGLKAIKAFIKDKSGSEIQAISDKIALLDMFAAQNIKEDAGLYLNNPSLISAAKQLHKAKLDHLLEDLLKREEVYKALDVLTRNHILINKEVIKELFESKEKCELINQQERLFQHNKKPAPEVYQGLITHILTLLRRTATAICKMPDDYRTPEAIVLVGQNFELQTLLLDEQKRCWPFLQNFFKEIMPSTAFWMKDFLIAEDKLKEHAEENYISLFEKNEPLFAALKNAVQKPECQLTEWSKVMANLNNFCESHTEKETKNIHPVFLKQIIPGLLSEQPAQVKKSDLNAEINRSYKKTGILGALLEFVAVLCREIKPYLSKNMAQKLSQFEGSFFSKANVKAKEAAAKESIAETNTSPETTPKKR